MRITIAGYGSVGRNVEALFGGTHEVRPYDPPLGLGFSDDLIDTDFVFVCVPTPALPDGSCDVSAVEEVVALSRPRVAVVCQSTVAVGTTDRLIETLGRPVVFVPEYAGELPDHPLRREQRDFYIYGGYEPAATAVRDLFAAVLPAQATHRIVAPREAETAKYMENAFLALKVAFCNEVYDFCDRAGVDYDVARALWTLDRRIGTSHTLVTPERGYGGKCLPKDVAAFCAQATQFGAPLSIMETARRSNDRVRAAAAPGGAAGDA